MAKYTIGVDFGTLSARAALVNVENGEVLATSSSSYEHGVMDEKLPNGRTLKPDWALQYAKDYKEALITSIRDMLEIVDVEKENIIGIGTDFTACTMIPILEDGTPLSELEEFKDRPHAYVKLWKHHAAERLADKLTELAKEENMSFLERYGGKISSEWELPKVWQIMEEDPEIYNRMDYFVEAGDWISYLLTGELRKSSCAAGYKGNWHYKEGYPSKEFLTKLHPLFENYVSEKINFPIVELGEACGYLRKEMAETLGLNEGIPVSASVVDSMSSFPATGITSTGQMQAAIGTSTCQLLLSETETNVPGITGVVYGGVYPGVYAYETGQAAVGDIFAWFVDECCSAEYKEAAEKEGMDLHSYLNKKGSELEVGENGIIALDWWNGNRSILSNYDLTGLLVGLTLSTKPEDIYRALLEATAYGTRVLIENYRKNGEEVNEYIAAGGISVKSPLTMQIYADVLNMPVSIADVDEGAAVGAACYAASAAGKEAGGYDNIYQAAENMGHMRKHQYKPIPENVEVYNDLYEEYVTLHDYFGRGENNVMIRLKNLRRDILEKKMKTEL